MTSIKLKQKFVISVVVASLSLSFLTCPARSGVTVPPAVSQKPDKTNIEQPQAGTREQAEWREKLRSAKVVRGLLIGSTAGSAIAGSALIIAGAIQNADAKNTPGCSQTGDTIWCIDERSTKQAQDKIDASKQKMTFGLSVSLVSLGLGVWTYFQHQKVQELEDFGFARGFKLTLDPQTRQLQLAYRHRF